MYVRKEKADQRHHTTIQSVDDKDMISRLLEKWQVATPANLGEMMHLFSR